MEVDVIANRRCVACGQVVYATEDPRPICFRCFRRRGAVTLVAAAAIWLLLWVAFTLMVVSVHGGVVDEAFLDRLAWRESRGIATAVGRRGEKGMFQLRPIALAECRRVYGWRIKDADLFNPAIARAAARGYCLICEHYLTTHLGRSPTQAEIMDGYRLGPEGFCRRVGPVGPRVGFIVPTQTPARPAREQFHGIPNKPGGSGGRPRAGVTLRGPRRERKCPALMTRNRAPVGATGTGG